MILGLVLITAIFAGTLFGTLAYFSKSFQSANNVAQATVFDVDVVNKEGETIGNADFSLDEDLFPGMETREVYSFDIRKNNTELPVEYDVVLSNSGALFKDSSPIVLTIQQNVDGQWVDIEPNTSITPDQDVESFRILLDWPHSDNDIAYAGKKGNLRLEVTATQVDSVLDVQGTEAMIREATTALTALDSVGSGLNRGNFSKAQSNDVQALIDSAKAYVDTFTNSTEKTTLLTAINKLQGQLNDKVNARYVYYSVVESDTHFEQLKLAISTDLGVSVNGRTQHNNPLYTNSGGEKNTLYLRYSNFSFVNPVVGDTVTLTVRFLGGYKNIDVTFTNLGDGQWGIESDWLVEEK